MILNKHSPKSFTVTVTQDGIGIQDDAGLVDLELTHKEFELLLTAHIHSESVENVRAGKGGYVLVRDGGMMIGFTQREMVSISNWYAHHTDQGDLVLTYRDQ